MIRYLTAGESHGKSLAAIIEGIPANFKIDIDKINNTLSLRQKGYGRSERMKIEDDKVEILSGIRDGKTLGSPICIKIDNKDWENWKDIMNIQKVIANNPITVPRPGHADLTGAIKYSQKDIRNIFERASSRETAIRTAVGCIAEQILNHFNIKIFSHVIQIGKIKSNTNISNFNEFNKIIKKSDLRCIDMQLESDMKNEIDIARENGDSLGGIFEIIAVGVPTGLGSCMHYDRKLDVRICSSLMSIQSIKGVEFGLGFNYSGIKGSECHDEIFYDKNKGYYRKTNNCGGIEGGMSNGENIVVRAAVKPIPTLIIPLKSIDIITKNQVDAAIHRSDTCIVPAASVIGQNVVAFEILYCFLEKFCGDSIDDIKKNYENYLKEKAT